MKRFLALISFSIGLVSCGPLTKEKNDRIAAQDTADTNTVQTNEGYTLMKNNCYACHHPNSASHDDLIAPPLVAVKRRYQIQYPKKEEFVNAMVEWVQNPSQERVLMPGAVDQFNVMISMPLDTEVLQKIASYMYENELERPDWFEEHFKEMHGNGVNN
ncbi:MAG: c-type cytochrome [Reichenbachiella sp.]|uniref:c-type cytochrome n=1 Tax=Reichenbachiella sp. TaxID=2184521 RepID=UPI00326731E4